MTPSPPAGIVRPAEGRVMQLVVPDILAEVARLSPAAAGIGLLLGLAVWCTGWLRRPFWIALAVTAGFGLYGVHLGRATGSHPLVTALCSACRPGYCRSSWAA